MSYDLKKEIVTIEVWHLAAIFISIIAVMYLYAKANRTSELKAFFYVYFTLLGWMITKVFKTVSPNIELRWTFVVIQYLFICVLEVAFIEFAYTFYKGKLYSSKLRKLLYILPFIQFLIVLTNPYHNMFYSYFTFRSDDFGILFYVHIAIEYLYIITGIVFLSIEYNSRKTKSNSRYMNIAAVAILMPFIGNVLYITRILETFYDRINAFIIFDVTPIVFSWSLILLVLATMNNKFFDMSLIMEHEILYALDTPICIVDSGYQIIFTNDKIQTLFESNNKVQEYILKNISTFAKENKSVMHNNKKTFEVYVKRLKSLSGIKRVIIFNDITKYEQIKNEFENKKIILEENNKVLNERINVLKETSRLGARNFVARELHDIIGHSLVVTMKLLEMLKIKVQKEGVGQTKEQLVVAKDALNEGYLKMQELKFAEDSQENISGIVLQYELEKIFNNAINSGLVVKFYFKGEQFFVEEKTYNIVLKVTRELITNCLKHSKATIVVCSIDISKKFKRLNFIDNGIGTPCIVKGNGLKGIENRLRLIDATAEYDSDINEGFSVNITF